jgi:hypothetical protein
VSISVGCGGKRLRRSVAGAWLTAASLPGRGDHIVEGSGGRRLGGDFFDLGQTAQDVKDAEEPEKRNAAGALEQNVSGKSQPAPLRDFRLAPPQSQSALPDPAGKIQRDLRGAGKRQHFNGKVLNSVIYVN